MRRVHGEATECVVFIGRQQNMWELIGWVGTECVVVFIGRAWTEQAMETGPGVPQNGGNSLVFDRPRSKRDPVHREGSGVPQNGGNGPPTVETGVVLIGRGVAYRKTDKTDLCWSATVETVVLFIGRGVAYRKTGLHEILFISIIDLLQPPRATVDLLQPPRAPVHPASTVRYSTVYCSTTPPRAPLHRLLFIQPSTPRGPVQPPLHGTPPLSTVHPALHHTTGSCSSRGNATAHCSSKPPATLTVHPRGSIDRLQLAAVAKESLDRVQLTAIDRSLRFSNA